MTPGTAVVTGAASGIGAGIAARLIDEGLDVLVVDRDEAGMSDLVERGATALVCDLADPESRDEVIRAAEGARYLVNSAGIIRLKRLADIDVDDFRDIFTVNVEAVFFLCQGIGPTMPPGGSIVNLSSSSAKLATTTEAGLYAASKTAVLSLTRSFAYDLASIPVRVNAVCPGIIDTPMQDAVLERVSELRGLTVEELSAARDGSVPLKRAASPAELAGLIRFLLSEEAGYMTGQAINYTGGLVTW
ncbi:MAG: SDR family NAD(P)-dependent oxidoreductase [Acidimicrobiales bacterium]